MPIDRRDMLAGGTACALGQLIAGRAIAQIGYSDDRFAHHFDAMLTTLCDHFSKAGYAEAAADPIITETPNVNDGLCLSADVNPFNAGEFRIQPCARVNDILDTARPDTLPLFHEFACELHRGAEPNAQFLAAMEFLTVPLGLDPRRFAFASVADAEVLRPMISGLGLDFDERVHIRDRDTAMKARDTSGFYFPDPDGAAYFTTIGIYYRLSDEEDGSIRQYPPQAHWIEVGEVFIGLDERPELAFGVERLVLAKGQVYPTKKDRMSMLIDMVEADRGNRAVPGVLQQLK